MIKLLILSSDELYEDNIIPSIFELSQANALKRMGVDVCIIANNNPYTVLGLLKNIFKKIFRYKNSNPKYEKPFMVLISLFFSSIFEYTFLKKNKPRELFINEVRVILNCYITLFSILRMAGNLKKWQRAAESSYCYYENKYGSPNLIHAHSRFLYAAHFAQYLKKTKNIPYVLTEHTSYYFNLPISDTIINILRRAINDASAFLVVSKALGEAVISRIPGIVIEYEVVPNMIDSLFEEIPLLYEDKKTNEFFTFICIASFDPIKGHTYLVKAFAENYRGNIFYRLTLLGDGESMDSIKKLCVEEKIDKQVIFLGRKTRMDVLRELDHSHVLVLPSEYETFGVSIIEAMSRGLPVIATKSGGPESIINTENGILCEKKNISSLCEAMKEIVRNYHTYNPDRIRNYVLTHYSSEVIAKNLINIYRRHLSST